MLKIKVIVVDRTRQPFLREGESFYFKRIRRYAVLEWIEVRPAKVNKCRPDEEILAEEGQNLIKRLSPRDHTVALDRSGRSTTSEGLALWLKELSERGADCVSFLIGGPLGLSDEVLARSREVLSLSGLTLTHEMSRLLLLEQIYRAFTILKGEKYHK